MHDDVIDTCRMMSTMTSEVTGDDFLSLRVAVTRILLGAVRPTLWPNRNRREAVRSNPSDYFKDYSSDYPTRNSTDHSNDHPTLNLTDYSNDYGTHNSTDNSKDYYSDYSTDYSTTATSRVTQLLTDRVPSNRYGVIDYLAKSIDTQNHIKAADVDGRKAVTTEIDAFTHNDVMTQSDAWTLSDAMTRNHVLTQNDELLESIKTNFKTTKNVKDQTGHSVTLIQNGTTTGGMSVSQSQGMTANVLTRRDMTASAHVTTTTDDRVTSISYTASPNGTGIEHDVISNVAVDTATDFTRSSDDVTVASQFISDATINAIPASTRMNSLVNNDSMVTDSMATNSMVTDSGLTNATFSGTDAEPVTENHTITPDAPGLDASTSDTISSTAIATVAMAISSGNGDAEDELVIYYDNCPISGATMAFLAMVLVLIAMVIVLNCYGPRWGHVYRWRYSCRQRPAGPRITADDNPCPMAHLAKVSDLPERVEQRAY